MGAINPAPSSVNLASPGPIGGTTPGTIAATQITAVSTSTEHIFTGNYANNGVDKANVMVIRHTASTGSCALRFQRYQDTYEMGAAGFQNGGGSFYLDGYMFVAGEPVNTDGSAPVASPTAVTLAQGGYYSGTKRQVRRFTLESDWTINIKGPDDAVKVYIDVEGRLSLGNASNGTLNRIDAWGTVACGLGGTSANRNNAGVTAGFPFLVVSEQANGQCARLVRDNIGKMDMTFQSTPSRMEFIDTDNSSVLPLTVYLDGSGKVKIGTLNISNIPTSASGLSAGDVWSNLGILTIV